MVTEVRVLGPVEVSTAGGEPSPVGGRRPSSILLALALAGGASVSTDRLVSEVWGDAPPPNAVDTLQSYLSRLRRVLEPDREVHTATALLRTAAGYCLAPEVVAVDAARFDAEVTEARGLTAVEDHAGAARTLATALRRWRGPVGQGAELGERGRTEATRLDELRLTATEEWVTAELALGRHHELTGELESLVVEHPTRERLHGLRMLALYRAGRQAEALAAFRQARSLLIEALGVEPSPQLHDLHARMLAQDASLAPPVGDLVGASPTIIVTAPVGGDRASGVGSAGGGGPPLGNLPAAMVELVGRDEHRRQLAEELVRSRLVTLTGAGGCGKTQLALQVARDVADRYADGAWLVELATVSEADGLLSHLAQVLGVDDAPLSRLLDGLVERLADRQLLLVLDNCEHLVDDCAMLVGELLRRCPMLQVLTTSRQTLDLDGEVAWRVPSLSLPAPDATLEQLYASDAARLFIARAAAAHDGFTPTADDVPWIAQICRELDGIPLALELAAARLRVLSVEEIAARLDDRFAVLRSTRRGVPARHQTLEAAITWSYELLDPDAQRLLRRLAVFEGPFTVAAAEATCADEHLAADRVLELLEGLVDRSLVLTVDAPIGPARHALLQTIRSFAWSRLEAADVAALAVSHARWSADLADAAATQLTGPDQVRWLNLLHTDHADLRAALRWSLDHGRQDLAVRIGSGVWWFWLQFGHAREGADWLERILAAVGPGDAGERTLLRAVYGAGRLAGAAGRTVRAVELLERAHQLAVALDALSADVGAPLAGPA
ncbi:MAG: BTAD domain-containing putative transcriptional regulator, partial [Nitriliruptoraceae bacterium]